MLGLGNRGLVETEIAITPIERRSHSGICIQPIDKRYAGREFELHDLIGGQPVKRHDERAKRIAVGGDQRRARPGAHRLDLLHCNRATCAPRILQALAARRRHLVGAAPDLHLLLTPFVAGVVLVEAGQIAVVAFVQRQIAGDRQ